MEDLATLNKQIEEMQERLRLQEKLSSLGMLSAGIAHEIQNPLNFVINFSKLSDNLLNELKQLLGSECTQLPQEEKEEIGDILCDLTENLHKIAEHGNRAISIIQGILLYSRGKEDEYVPTDAARLTKEYVWLGYHAMRANYKNFNISIHEDYADGLSAVKLIPQDFSRVVLNIMNNACYAVWKKAQEHPEDGYQPIIRIKLAHEDNILTLTIEDNGVGMSREVQQKLFEAFFTTKPVGQGTGLGMSIVKDIIEHKHHGSIHFTSEEGQYTRFTFHIPMNL
ncbi:sensor histidine kinase [Bacteroides sp.]|uniref:sensor histidine kinase n=1 Tax=Bacteroides sp. TaxID=29523 RepID=UPI002619FF28|nr:HAMP domain-containing sensor histidine kinase [Bacteroides sp.]MDD3036581.1 HAMP domain-containing sensor histidine kinase [Bacteroides sp.]